ncbi:transposable element Tc1 transposase [Trichonephila clavipes]|nr:transposable element Tc1 transposase [Trichonephila clavipes]
MPRRGIRVHYEQLSKFERGRIIGLKEGVWANRRIARHMGRSDVGKNGWTVADFRAMMVAVDLGTHDESRFHLCPGDHRRRVWRRPKQRADPVFIIARPTGPQQGVMYPGLIFLQDNAGPHMARVAKNCLTAYQTLPWPARSPDPSPI